MGILDFQPFTDEDLAPPAPRDLPKGDYKCVLIQTDLDRKDNGTQIVLRWGEYSTLEGGDTVIDPGDGKEVVLGNRVMFQREWITHNNPQAQDIGRRRLTQIAKAFGLTDVTTGGDGKEAHCLPNVDSEDELVELFGGMIDTPIKQYVARKKRKDTGEMESVVGSVTAL